jgi:predicted XRE-type DNA-binding protein
LKSKIDKKLVRKLVQKGLIQTEIAKELKVSRMSISDVFKQGEYKRLRSDFVAKIIHNAGLHV